MEHILETEINIVPASGLNTTRSILFINGDKKGMSTEFPHLKHQDMLGKEVSCINCHHMSLPNDKSTPCSRCHRSMFNKTLIFNHDNHTTLVAQNRHISGLHPENKVCVICHSPGSPKNVNSAVGCMDCHKEDMNIADTLNLPKQFLYADSYINAMHSRCITCHKKEKNVKNRPDLDQCSNCHKDYFLVDESVPESVTTERVKEVDSGWVLALDVIPRIESVVEPQNVFDILFRAEDITTFHLSDLRLKEADYDKIEEIISAGKAEVRENIIEIKK